MLSAASAFLSRLVGGEDPAAEVAREHAELLARWPHRSQQLRTLLSLLGRPLDDAARVLVFGGPGSGKTGVVRDAVATARFRSAYASCLDCHTPRLLFETLLGALDRADGCPSSEAPPRCAALHDFIAALRARALRAPTAVYLIVDEAQRLADKRWGSAAAGTSGQALLSLLLRVDELTGVNVGVVLLSTSPWSAFRAGTGFCTPLLLHFPAYDTAALAELLCASAPPACCAGAVGADAALWRAFVGQMMGAYGGSCRSVHELRTLLAPLWRHYTQPLAEAAAGGRPGLNAAALYTRLARGRPGAGALHASLAVPLSTGALALADEQQPWPLPCVMAAPPGGVRGGGGGGGGGGAKLDFDVPSKSKFLLLAAFVAARTPQGDDPAAFRDAYGGVAPSQRKRKHGGAAGGGQGAATAAARHADAQAAAALRGPTTFSLERLLAIFQAIVSQHSLEEEEAGAEEGGAAAPGRTEREGRPGAEGDAGAPVSQPEEPGEPLGADWGRLDSTPSVPPALSPPLRAAGRVNAGSLLSDVFQQVTSLCDLGLLACVSADTLEAPRYRCAVTEPLARQLAANANVPLDKYLLHRPV